MAAKYQAPVLAAGPFCHFLSSNIGPKRAHTMLLRRGQSVARARRFLCANVAQTQWASRLAAAIALSPTVGLSSSHWTALIPRAQAATGRTSLSPVDTLRNGYIIFIAHRPLCVCSSVCRAESKQKTVCACLCFCLGCPSLCVRVCRPVWPIVAGVWARRAVARRRAKASGKKREREKPRATSSY